MLEKKSPPLSEDKACKLLCVGIDDEILEDIKDVMSHLQCNILATENVQNGFSLAKRFTPDLIISSETLPQSEHFKFCDKIKQHPLLLSRILLLTTDTKSVNLSLNKHLWFDEFVYYPINPIEFKFQVTSTLKIKMLLDKLANSNEQLNTIQQDFEKLKEALNKKNKLLLNEKRLTESSLKHIEQLIGERRNTKKKLAQITKNQKKNTRSLLQMMISLLEMKDPFYRRHSKKVAQIAAFMAKKMGLSPKEIKLIYIAARLHEIGKLKTSNNVQYAFEGAMLLSEYHGLEKIAHIIKHLNENVDGSGIPDKLVGNNIPIGSRIITLANTYDNIVYNKSKLTLKKIFNQIENQVGEKFDANITYYLYQYTVLHPPTDQDRIQELSIHELKPGMKLAKGIFTCSGAKLLPINTILTEQTITKMAHYNQTEPLEEMIYVKAI